MNNITGIGLITTGNAKRITITYQVADETGKITSDNIRTNKLITNDEVLSAVTILNNFAQSIVDGTEYKSSTTTSDTTSTTTTQ